MASRALIAIAILAGVLPATSLASVLYKSVDANGIVMFSDMPPPAGSRILEERPLPSSNVPSAALPEYGVPGVVPAERLLDFDAAIANANAQVDKAERELAQARRELGPAFEGVRLRPTRLAAEDDQRLDPYRNNLKIARRHLMELLRDRRVALRQ